MKSKDIDWKVLRGALITLTVSLLLAGGVVGSSYYFQENMKKEYRRHDAQFKSISGRYLAIDEEERLIKKYFPVFVELYNRGVIGREQRLHWIETMRKAGEEINLPMLNYQIKSQSEYIPGFQVTLGKYKLYSSTVSLSMQLSHEGDLFMLLEELSERANGIYNVSRCKMRSDSEIVTNIPNAANITVECDLQWFTIKLADGTEIKV